ncbi:unnamed protein product [Gongylonema pulchrum]|uniref:S100P-binding protein n=1 Tax=Gongylonema pulchrum TaxID=637853 RepID=A0A183DAB1_9BILA|nr:unnamed protein product [Gongylonema pulchrum]
MTSQEDFRSFMKDAPTEDLTGSGIVHHSDNSTSGESPRQRLAGTSPRLRPRRMAGDSSGCFKKFKIPRQDSSVVLSGIL